MNREDEADYLAKWMVLLGFPLWFGILILLSLSEAGKSLSSFFGSSSLLKTLYPGPTIAMTVYILGFFLALCISSLVGLAVSHLQKTRRRASISTTIIFLVEFVLLATAVSSYFSNIVWRLIFEYFEIRIGWSILVLLLGTFPAALVIPILLDRLMSRFWLLTLGYAPGIFKGQFYNNLRRAWRKGLVKKTVAVYVKVGIAVFPIFLAVLVILSLLGVL